MLLPLCFNFLKSRKHAGNCITKLTFKNGSEKICTDAHDALLGIDDNHDVV